MATRLLYANSSAGSIVGDNRLNPFNFIRVPICSTNTVPDHNYNSEGVINAFAKDASSNLYIGTDFIWYDGVQINKLAKWNGSTWSSLGSGPTGGTHGGRIYAMCRIGNYIYMAGLFTSVSGTSATNIIRYDTVNNTWAPLGSGLNGQVYALATDGTNLYAGGNFSTPYTNFAKWDGSAWSNVGSPSFNGRVRTIRAVSASEIYVGGEFTTPTAKIAKWNGTAWSTFGSGVAGSGYVYDIALDGTGPFAIVYVCGTFTQAAGNASSYIMKWYSPSWSAVGTAPNSWVDSVEVWNGNVFAVGPFSTIGGVSASYIAKWNGSAWSAALGNGLAAVGQPSSSLYLDGGQLYVHGMFTGAGGMSAVGLARFAVNGSGNSSWARVSSSATPNAPLENYYKAAEVFCLAKDASGNIYMGGTFTTLGGSSDWGGIAAKGVAKWNGSSWTTLGAGLTDPVNLQPGRAQSLLVNGTDLYVGGDFTQAGSTSANYIAKWNGSAWSALGSGCSAPVTALAFISTTLYAGLGGFAPGLVKWNGSAWSTVGSTGLDDWMMMQSPTVSSLVVSGTDLYIGGTFAYADGITVNNVAKWNGSAYSSIGTGWIDQSDYIMSMTFAGGSLYAVGNIMAYSNIAKWTGSAWSPIGDSGLNGMASSVVSSPSSTLPIYIGGAFTADIYDTIPANKVISWNGTTFSGLGNNSSDTSSIAYLLLDSYTDTTVPTVGGSGTLTTSNVSYNSMTLAWTKATDNFSQQAALRYRVYYSLSSAMTTVANIEANGTPVAAYAVDIATINITGLSGSTTYYLNVIVKDEAENKSAYTMKTQVTTVPPDTTPPTPGNSGTITTSNVGANAVTLNWTAATDNVDDPSSLLYRVYYSTNPNLSTVQEIKANGTPFEEYA